MALALYACVGLLATMRHAPWILIFLVFVQATVYICAPIASVWNLFAQGTPDVEYRRRWEERRLREQRRRRPLAWLPRPAFGATLAALAAGGVAGALLLPVPLLSATTADASARTLATSAGTEVYLKLGSAAHGAQGTYYPLTTVHLSTGRKDGLKLSFGTSSLVLLNDILNSSEQRVTVPCVTQLPKEAAHTGLVVHPLLHLGGNPGVKCLQLLEGELEDGRDPSE